MTDPRLYTTPPPPPRPLSARTALAGLVASAGFLAAGLVAGGPMTVVDNLRDWASGALEYGLASKYH